QFDIDTMRGVRKQISADTAQQGLEHNHHEKTESQYMQRGKTLMHDHLVHHHLEKQRCDQCEQLQEKTGDQHFTKKPFVFQQCRNEPADVELLAQAFAEAATTGKQQQFSSALR